MVAAVVLLMVRVATCTMGAELQLLLGSVAVDV
jgi:hypothetical protein